MVIKMRSISLPIVERFAVFRLFMSEKPRSQIEVSTAMHITGAGTPYSGPFWGSKAAAQIALGASGTPGAQVAHTMVLARSLGRGRCPGQIYGEISLSLAQFRFEHLVGLRQCECATDRPAGERAARADSGVAAKESKVVSHTTCPYHHTIGERGGLS